MNISSDFISSSDILQASNLQTHKIGDNLREKRGKGGGRRGGEEKEGRGGEERYIIKLRNYIES